MRVPEKKLGVLFKTKQNNKNKNNNKERKKIKIKRWVSSENCNKFFITLIFKMKLDI